MEIKNDFCIITYCNESFTEKTNKTIEELRNNGKYYGDIVVIIGDDLKDRLEHDDDRVIIKYFPEIDRTEQINKLLQKPITHRSDYPEVRKVFQWHKIFAFHSYFKKWKYCWGIDGGMRIFKPVDKIIYLAESGKFLAQSDAYPNYEMKLSIQFDQVEFPEIYEELKNNFDLDRDYFQTTTFLYDTDLIDENTCNLINEWSLKYFTSMTNDQGVINLYFNNYKEVYKEIKHFDSETYYYDFMERDGRTWKDYIMLKQARSLW